MFKLGSSDQSSLSSFLRQSRQLQILLVSSGRRTAMDAISILPNVPPLIGSKHLPRTNGKSNNLFHGSRHRFNSRRQRVSAVAELSTITSDPITPQITWQIVVGSIAGVTPFVVAGIEFSKRIVAQKKCVECGGSGLVMIEKEYIRCPNCGGFLPWQSWKRFFSG